MNDELLIFFAILVQSSAILYIITADIHVIKNELLGIV